MASSVLTVAEKPVETGSGLDVAILSGAIRHEPDVPGILEVEESSSNSSSDVISSVPNRDKMSASDSLSINTIENRGLYSWIR
ncbi:uncharacterized protein ColSpa_12004 [Colletotrichum spaethianum]|uniref:Uncharacterized protein n=1 Tax=Colletotrichum spaethianum TaxID=700344 RepID=A0AA37PGL4_9PEZI|nr:uncharacterized protein ColSpa_12004 [Colletotrichum spaethianum]GKT51823.1 hypothetical protein ColSpa_12004 [Colletotrichum spaethianum]